VYSVGIPTMDDEAGNILQRAARMNRVQRQKTKVEATFWSKGSRELQSGLHGHGRPDTNRASHAPHQRPSMADLATREEVMHGILINRALVLPNLPRRLSSCSAVETRRVCIEIPAFPRKVGIHLDPKGRLRRPQRLF